jgi:hypothetical protein
VQNSNASPNPFSAPLPLCFENEALARAYLRARERMSAAAGPGDIFAAFSPDPDEDDDAQREPHGPDSVPAPTDDDEPSDTDELASIGELLCVLAEPIEWGLAQAERRAHGDSAGLAAIQRVRDAMRIQLASLISGIPTPTIAPRIRATDLLIIAGLFARAVDPRIAQRAAQGVRDSVASALGRLLELDPSLPAYLAQAAASLGASPAAGASATPRSGAPHAAVIYWYRDELPSSCAPSLSPLFGPVPLRPALHGPTPLDGRVGVPHPAMSGCCWRHGRVL